MLASEVLFRIGLLSNRFRCNVKQNKNKYAIIAGAYYRFVVFFKGIFDKLLMFALCTIVISKVAFIDGSSKQGNTRLANTGWKWDAVMYLNYVIKIKNYLLPTKYTIITYFFLP